MTSNIRDSDTGNDTVIVNCKAKETLIIVVTVEQGMVSVSKNWNFCRYTNCTNPCYAATKHGATNTTPLR